MKKRYALKKCVLAAAFIVASGASLAAGLLENIPLTWKPTTKFAELGAVDLTDLSKVKIQFDMLKDTRRNPALIAENREKAEIKPVTTKDDVAASRGRKALHGG